MFKSLLVSIGLCSTVVNAHYDADVNDRPRYHVDILRLDPDTDTIEHICDGAILDSRHLITAAHCVVEEKAAYLRIRSGSDVTPPPNMPHQEERLFHRVTKVMYPKDYVYTPCRHHEHDVAILKVNRAFDLSYYKLFKHVDLPEPDNDFEDYVVSLSGYNEGTLNTMDVKVVSNEECSRKSSSIVTRGNVCGIVDETTAKLSISGSPLVHENTIVGVLNAAAKCENNESLKIKCVEQPATLKLYTRVSAYLDFIDKVLNRQASADIVYKS